jgi:pimeloyl-ACP methyl ester carboxylesterase
MNVTTIVLINGLWMTGLSWEHWVKHYTDKGYRVIAVNWPGMEGDIEQLRHDPSSFATLGLSDVVDHYEQIVCELESPPLIIGYGFGGLVTQILLDRRWGAAGVAIASAPPKGIARLPLSVLKLAFSVLGKSHSSKAASLTAEQFAFVNSLTETESLDAFKRYVVPAPNRVLLQTAFANFISHTPATVNFRNDTRAPLLLVAGGKDRVVPRSLVKANFELYRESKAETDYKEFADRTHFMIGQKGWEKVADYVLGWALGRANGSKLTAASNQTDPWSVQLST